MSALRTTAALTRAALAVLVIGALLVAVPLLLLNLIGNPYPDNVNWNAPLTDQAVLGVLACVAWVFWAQTATCLITEILVEIRIAAGGSADWLNRIPGTLPGQQALARALVQTVVAVGLTSAVAMSAGPWVTPTEPVSATLLPTRDSTHHALRVGSPVKPASATTTSPPAPQAAPRPAPAIARNEMASPSSDGVARAGRDRQANVVVEVVKGDSLWSIAEDRLGDGQRWSEIAELNHGRTMTDGLHFTGATTIQPGWHLQIPAPRTPPPAAHTGPASGLRPGPSSEGVVTVRHGDTLWDLAHHAYGHGEDWDRIYAANRDQLNDPDLLTPGQHLRLPPRTSGPAGQATHHTGNSPIHTAPPPPVAPTTPAQRPPNDPPSAPTSPPPGMPINPPIDPPVGLPTGLPSTPPVTAPGPEPRPSVPATSTTQVGSFERGAESHVLALTLAGGGGVLAAGLLAALASRRRIQFRARRSGRTIARTPADLVEAERTVRTSGSAAGDAARFLDLALRGLSAELHAIGGHLPEVKAVRVTEQHLELHLADPIQDYTAQPLPQATIHGPPEPWRTGDNPRHWILRREHTHGPLSDVPPYPSLVSIGADEAGATWLVDLEAAGMVHLTGDPTGASDLARFITAELAVNPWANLVEVTLVGLAAELVALNPTRLSTTDTLDLGTLTKTARRSRKATETSGLSVLQGRLDQTGADSWLPMVVLSTGGALNGPEAAGMADLADELARTPGRSSVALVHTGGPATPRVGIVLEATTGGLITPWGVLTPSALTADEAATLAHLFVAATDLGDEPMPAQMSQSKSAGDTVDISECVPERAGPDRRFAIKPEMRAETDVAGALHVDLTWARDPAGDPTSLLPLADAEYLSTAATTTTDLNALAPQVSPGISSRVIAADPDLDTDLADWTDPHCCRPKIRVLGPVEARVPGERPRDVENRTAYYAEMLAYLATRPDGATPGQMAEAFCIANNTLHSRIGTLRKWLGTDPATQVWHLPESTLSEAGKARGVPVYQLTGVLSDAALFKRLRTRGQARGPEGIDDLAAALGLAAGPVFDQLRSGGYGWLAETPEDHYLTAAIVDIAHVIATHALASGDPRTAAWAAERAITVAPSDDKPRLDLGKAWTVMGDPGADTYLREHVFNRVEDDTAPAELSNRTDRLTGDAIQRVAPCSEY